MRRKFGQQPGGSQMPEVNLVPMMDVVMTILTFFIIVSMTLTSYQASLNVQLPSTNKQVDNAKPTDPLILQLTAEGKLVIEGAPVEPTNLGARLTDYFGRNPEGLVVLQADKKMPYDKIEKVLRDIRAANVYKVALQLAS
jgi:biopolymer transport protein ExbD